MVFWSVYVGRQKVRCGEESKDPGERGDNIICTPLNTQSLTLKLVFSDDINKYIFLTYYFEIINASQEVAKIVPTVLCVCPPAPPGMTSHIAVIQHPNQDTDNQSRACSDFTTYTCIHILCAVLPHRQSCVATATITPSCDPFIVAPKARKFFLSIY